MYRDDRITKAEYKAAKKVDLTKEFQPKADPAETTKSYGYVYNLLETQATDIMAKQLAKEANVSTAKLNKDPNLYKQYETQATELLSTKAIKFTVLSIKKFTMPYKGLFTNRAQHSDGLIPIPLLTKKRGYKRPFRPLFKTGASC